jgi:tetratricopeptide (TPR) repeat protein
MSNLEKLKEQARKFEAKEQWAKAIEPLVKAIELYEKSPDNEADLVLYNKVGDLYSRLNDAANAAQYYDRAVDRYSDIGLVNNAIALCNKVLRLNPGRVHSYLKLGMLFAKKGFMAEAKQNLLEYADRMQKAGQIEEAFRALKKFAEMTPGQEEIWAMLAQQARASARTPEQVEQVDKLLSEFEAKDKAHQQRRSRMSRSMITGEEIPEDTGPKKGELIFLDIDDVPTPGRRSSATLAPAAPPPPPPPPPRVAPPLPVAEEPPAAPEITPLEIEPPFVEAPGAGLGFEPTSLGIEPTSLGIEPAGLDIEPAAIDGAGVDTPRQSTGLDFGTIELEPAATPPPPPPPQPAPRPAPPPPPPEPVAPELPELEVAPAASADLPMLDTGLELEPAAVEPELAAEVPLEAIEFEDLGAVEVPLGPGVPELERRIAADPNDWAGHRLLGEALIAQGERDRGLAELDASLEGFDSADDLSESMSVVEEILRLDRNSVRHQQKRVELAYRSGDRARLVDAYVELADALLRSDDVEKAIAVYQRVVEHDPGNPRAQSALETLAPPAPPEPSRPAAGPKAPAAPAAPAAPQGDYVDLGSFLFEDEPAEKDTRMRIEDEEPTGDEQKDFQAMLAAFKKGIDANVEETDFQSHYDLGVAYKEMGLLDEAIAEFQKALRAAEGRLKSSEALGLCFFEKGQFSVAETILKRGLDFPAGSDAERIGLLYWLGRAQEEQRKVPEALGSYNRVFAVDINFQDVNQRVRALQKAGV